MNGLVHLTELIEQNNGLNEHILATAFDTLYPEIKSLAQSQLRKIRSGDTITPTVLVNECYLKVIQNANARLSSSKHLICLMAKCMRQFLIDELRSKNRCKRTGKMVDMPMSELIGETDKGYRLLELNDVIRQLENIDPHLAELTELRFFSGLTMDEISQTLNTSTRQLNRHWSLAKSLLASLLNEHQSTQYRDSAVATSH